MIAQLSKINLHVTKAKLDVTNAKLERKMFIEMMVQPDFTLIKCNHFEKLCPLHIKNFEYGGGH